MQPRARIGSALQRLQPLVTNRFEARTRVYELVSVPLIRYQTPLLSPLKSLAKLSLLVLSCKQGLVCQNQ